MKLFLTTRMYIVTFMSKIKLHGYGWHTPAILASESWDYEIGIKASPDK
jgi:hypothetical protein